MRSYKNITGFTLVEILIVVAIIMVLAGIAMNSISRINAQAKEQLAEGTLELIDSALSQFAEAGYDSLGNAFRNPAAVISDEEVTFLRSLKYPPDFNDMTAAMVEAELERTTGVGTAVIGVVDAGAVHLDVYSGSEVMYLFLSKVPQCKEILERIDRSLVTDKDELGLRMKITINGEDFPLRRIVDPWGRTLRYSYYRFGELPAPQYTAAQLIDMRDRRKNFPLVESAGADGIFDTNDDISNR